ncbi:Zn-dependent hydrolase [Skermanella rosea]|uniref:Zn-dependent hydrolase n=1 Tax=Skermanella rosea TaxID=1817965 RepID=UPI001931B564|nr:Zn-dependent hydrolase [Skermanella rosea]UEM06400.1 Zn-dependent hydrolase [Skermanella rosea]
MTSIPYIDEARLWKRHMAMAKIGALPGGGVNRPALSPGDAQSRSLLARWAEELGFSVATDPIGNLFVRRPGTDDSLAPVMSGSHLDTQPTGGKFDGAFGVLAAFEALQAIHEAGIVTKRPIEVVSWTNEEGSRFQPGCSGSSAFTGAIPLDRILAAVDRDGIAARDALAAVLASERGMAVRPLGFPVAAYLECHIEQGPRLEEAGIPVGIVTGIQGSRWFAVEVLGDEAHAGTTPRRNRRDALVGAVAMVSALERLMHDEEDRVRFTVGRFEVQPGSPNTIPGRVFFTIDFRHPEASTLKRLGDQVDAVCRAHAGPCAVTIEETFHSLPTEFDQTVVAAMRGAAERLGIRTLDLSSGALHDAKFLQDVCPSGMLFVPCEGGISHNEAENAKPSDLADGTRVLAEALVTLANA